MATYNRLRCAIGSEDEVLQIGALRSHVFSFLETLGPREDVLIVPPDYTRFHSQAGTLSQIVAEYYGFIQGDHQVTQAQQHKAADALSKNSTTLQILPALGTHAPMTREQITTMFGAELAAKNPSPFLVHDWRNDVVTIGHVPDEMVREATNGLISEPWPAQLNRVVWQKRHKDPCRQNKSLILSIGQVVPHEVMGMANFNKNLFVGVGGVEAINLSHFIGAVHGMENMMGRAHNPLRAILNHASEKFLQHELDLWYILTVVKTNPATGEPELCGLFIGNDIECYNRACDLSLKVNFSILPKAPTRMVVYLDPDEFHSTWLGNKAIYRTRMAIADGGDLIILAPGVKRFGEDSKVDELIRKYGYVGTPMVMKATEENQELKENLSAAAHLIHGSSEGRFKVTYCPGHLTREEVESVGFAFADLQEMSIKYDIKNMKHGWNEDDEGEFFFISNPALGLWAVKERFKNR